MDPSYVDSDEEADAMAAAMGFSSFGTQPNKKRKFNPKTDAIVDAEKPVPKFSSGGNNIPLGKPRTLGTSATSDVDNSAPQQESETNQGGDKERNEDEIEIEEEEEAVPNYVDTSAPAPAEEASIAQAKIDAILGLQTTPGTAAVPANVIGAGPTFAAPPPPQYQPQEFHPLPAKPGGRQFGRQGERNDLWYLGYFDPSFVSNPWEKLEKKNKMAPMGNWV